MSANTQALVRYAPPGAPATVGETMQMAEAFFRSGFFADTKSAAAALVKIQAGRELGFGPMASMTGVHVIEGKPSIGAHLMAAMIRSSGRYDYRVVESTKERCELEFLRLVGKKWEPQTPAIVCTLEEFVANGTAVSSKGKPGETPSLKTNWHRSPDDMLFARAISKGYRRHCPDLSCGVSVYVDGEIAGEESPPPVVGEIVDSRPTVNGTLPPAEGPSMTLHEALAGQQPADAATLDRLGEKMGQLRLDADKSLARARTSYGSGRAEWEWANLTAAQAADLEAKLDGQLAKAKTAEAVTVPSVLRS